MKLKKIPVIDWYMVGRAIRDSGDNVSPSQFSIDMERCIKAAKRFPKDYRDVRASFRHHRDMGSRSEGYMKIHSLLEGFGDTYGYRSLAFQTLLEAVNCVELSRDQVLRKWQKSKIAPAYNPGIRSGLSTKATDDNGIPISLDKFLSMNPSLSKIEYDLAIQGYNRRCALLNWVSITPDPVIQKVKDIIRNPRGVKGKDGKRIYRFSRLTNGSSAGIRVWDTDIMDIEAQCFDGGFNTDFPAIKRYFGIANYDEDTDSYFYIPLNNQWKGADGKHNVIPDKDGKSREVYIINWMFQCILKACVQRWDRDMREVPGIFTYKQGDWLDHVMEFEWNKRMFIVTVDMEKFSDTIVREYLLELLYTLGLPKSVCNELNEILAPSIYDPTLDENMGSNDVVLQGQYLVFMIMSLLNLCIQRFIIYHFEGDKIREYTEDFINYCNAVLGDDTGMVFTSGKLRDTITEYIKSTYGSFGMVINELKSDTIDKGVGQGDFAKEHFDCIGFIDHLNVKNVENQNLDGIINDILTLKGHSIEYKEKMINSLFGESAAYEILHLNKINGGLLNAPISEEDVNIYINNLTRINLVMRNQSVAEEQTVLKRLAIEYRKYGFSLRNSPLLEFVPENKNSLMDLPEDESDQIIMGYVLQTDRIGSDINLDLIRKSVGEVPSDMEKTWKEERFRSNKSMNSLIWNEFLKFDAFMAKRKMGKKGRYSSIYAPCINGSIDLMKCFSDIDSSILRAITDTTLSTIDEMTEKYKVSKSKAILASENIILTHRWVGCNQLHLVEILDNHSIVASYRVHAIDSPYYTSVFPSFTEEVFENTLLPILIKHRCSIEYETFVHEFRNGKI